MADPFFWDCLDRKSDFIGRARNIRILRLLCTFKSVFWKSSVEFIQNCPIRSKKISESKYSTETKKGSCKPESLFGQNAP